MPDISSYFSHIGFYLAFFFVFTYCFATFKSSTDIHKASNNITPRWVIFLVLCVLTLATALIIIHPIYYIVFNSVKLVDFEIDVFFTLLIHTLIYLLIAILGYWLIVKAVLHIAKTAQSNSE